MRNLLLAIVRVVVGAHGRYATTPPNAQQTIYFANHASHVDTLAILAALPSDIRENVRPAAARDYWDATPARRFIATHVLRVVFVERKHESGSDPLELVKDALGAGFSIILFPEGTRSLTGEIGPFKTGLYWLSAQFPYVALVPVHLSNLARAMPKGKLLPVPITCQVSFGNEIVRADADNSDDKDAFLERARDAVVNLQDSAQGKPCHTSSG
ncbi:MAG TPA: lysophospholipid acyltransferase family protein [Paraburkholderia sp.]|uniref:lysophospholipid acyltransferase family protein n=1 Tax=Paraburkholderia sp. TaxID=1926495 RepID=UPI002B470CA1|nr:lysophospholipid acyltransferase family protein [Paraburkholderia sp.]HKR43390.1 lysophospholipid acyltransferase family protein [Paraburkholderia sp.]